MSTHVCFFFSCSSAWWEKHSLWPLTAPTEKGKKKKEKKKKQPSLSLTLFVRARDSHWMWHRQRKQPRLLSNCASARYGRRSAVCESWLEVPESESLSLSVSLSLSPWQAVNHLRWRAAWRRSASVDCSNCCATSLSAVLLTTCSCRNFYFFFLLTSSFCLLALVAPTKYPRLSRHFQQTRSKNKTEQKKQNNPSTAPINYYQSEPDQLRPDDAIITSKKKKKQTKREWERKGWREVEGRDPACN